MKPEPRRQEQSERLPYEAPAIIYEGELTTRAGSLIPGSGLDYDVDPTKLFGNLG